WLFPALGEMRLYDIRARRNIRTNLIAQQRAVDKAEGGIGLSVEGEVVIEVDWIIAAHAQDPAALRGVRFCSPEQRGRGEWQGCEGEVGCEAPVQYLTTA